MGGLILGMAIGALGAWSVGEPVGAGGFAGAAGGVILGLLLAGIIVASAASKTS